MTFGVVNFDYLTERFHRKVDELVGGKVMWKDNEWNTQPPENDGDFFYSGDTPNGEEIVAIVQVLTNLENGERWACLFIPPYWRKDETRKQGTMHWAKVEDWKGVWSGAERGLCCAIYPSND